MKRKRRYTSERCNGGKNYLVWDNETGECLGFIAQIVGRLNLQEDIINDLKKENEQLKKEHKIAIDEMITDYKNLEKENEQLKKAKADGKNVLLVDKEQLEKELLGAETPFDKLYKKYLEKWEKEMNKRYSDKRRVITRRFK